MPGPVYSPPGASGLGPVLERNIAALSERRAEAAARASTSTKLSDRITAFTGSMAFLLLHLVFYGTWTLWNAKPIPGLTPFDPSFVILATEASVEAIFLSTFVLISQNRQAKLADERAELDLQISLLAEHEITGLARLVDAIARKLDVHSDADAELPEIEQDVAPVQVLEAIENAERAEKQPIRPHDASPIHPTPAPPRRGMTSDEVSR